MPIPGSITDDIPADEIRVLSSEEIVIEDSVGDAAAETEQRSTYLKFQQAISTITKPDIIARFLKKVDRSS